MDNTNTKTNYIIVFKPVKVYPNPAQPCLVDTSVIYDRIVEIEQGRNPNQSVNNPIEILMAPKNPSMMIGGCSWELPKSESERFNEKYLENVCLTPVDMRPIKNSSKWEFKFDIRDIYKIPHDVHEDDFYLWLTEDEIVPVEPVLCIRKEKRQKEIPINGLWFKSKVYNEYFVYEEIGLLKDLNKKFGCDKLATTYRNLTSRGFKNYTLIYYDGEINEMIQNHLGNNIVKQNIPEKIDPLENPTIIPTDGLKKWVSNISISDPSILIDMQSEPYSNKIKITDEIEDLIDLMNSENQILLATSPLGVFLMNSFRVTISTILPLLKNKLTNDQKLSISEAIFDKITELVVQTEIGGFDYKIFDYNDQEIVFDEYILKTNVFDLINSYDDDDDMGDLLLQGGDSIG